MHSMSSVPKSQTSFILVLIMVGIGLSQAARINLGGQLTGFEIISLAGAGLALFSPPIGGWHKTFKWILYALVGWLVIQLTTDGIRHIPITDMAKGIARIVTFSAIFIFLWRYIIPHKTRVGGVLVGLGLSYIGIFYLYSDPLEVAEPWKWCWGPAATFGLIGGLLVTPLNSKLLWRLVLIGLGVVHFAFNFRSFGAICLLSGVIPFLWPLVRPVPILIRCILGVCGILGMAWGYGQLASGDLLGEAAEAKYRMQSKEGRGAFSYLSGGRPEYQASLKAISQSPVLGYGSWAKHPEFVYELWDPEKGDFDIRRMANALELGVIPSHSHLLGAWVDGGILPGLLWACLWVYVFYHLNRQDWTMDPTDAVTLMFGVGLLWSIMFSPFGSGNRLMTALSICIVFHRVLRAGADSAKQHYNPEHGLYSAQGKSRSSVFKHSKRSNSGSDL
jgi:hypothetical protein